MRISTGSSVTAKKWTVEDLTWDQFVERCKHRASTLTRAQFDALDKDKQTQTKDVGGFVGGALRDGIRKKGFVQSRDLITLDLDKGTAEKVKTALEKINSRALVYSTFKHLPQSPRLRIVLPLSRPLDEAEYEPAAREIAYKLGLELFDTASFNPAQLMFWGSHPSDIKPFFKVYEGTPLDADELLKGIDLDNTETWKWGDDIASSKIAELPDPTLKDGHIGQFCRAYSIQEAIDKFIPETYERVGSNRYRYKDSNSMAGALVYGDLYLYSHHENKDPAADGHAKNAFDLVRVHKFGDLDKGSKTKDPNNLPSFKAMCEFCKGDDGVRAAIVKDEFTQVPARVNNEESDKQWLKHLSLSKAGKVQETLANCELIIANDPQLKGIYYDTFSNYFKLEYAPWKRPNNQLWNDSDFDALLIYLSRVYGLEISASKLSSALSGYVRVNRTKHPVKDYLDKLKWDGIPRLDTLFIDYLGADDTALNRAVTSKTFIAAVRRIYDPGCKFDAMTTLVGPQGIGKSFIFRKMGSGFYTESLTIRDMQDKTAAEKLQGKWIAEIPELAGMRKVESETVKSFITRQVDEFRQAYGRIVEHRPRQGILVATTNEETGFLKDLTGNRRHWVVNVKHGNPQEWNIDVDQVWAEAVARQDESLLLDPVLIKEMTDLQTKALESDPWEEPIASWLEYEIPENWDKLELAEHMAYWSGTELTPETLPRQYVSISEIFKECLNGDILRLDKPTSNRIARVLKKLGWIKGKTLRTKAYGVVQSYTNSNKNKETLKVNFEFEKL